MLKKIKHHWIEFDTLRQNPGQKKSAAFIGAPDDRGVLNVGGRLSAGHGPDFVRKMLSSFMLGTNGEIESLQLSKGFNIELGHNIEDGHATLRKSVTELLEKKIFPIVLGGGHDYGFPHVAGTSDYYGVKKTALVNIDAHLDVRPPDHKGISSGSPFYLALESGVLSPKNFYEFGIQPHCNQQSQYEYLKKKGVSITFLDEARQKGNAPARLKKLITSLARKKLNIIVNVDVDAIQMAFAPGVSAQQSDGFTAQEIISMMNICGENEMVKTLGFFEYAPILDQDEKTNRLVATCIHRFLCAFSRQGGRKARLKKKSAS